MAKTDSTPRRKRRTANTPRPASHGGHGGGARAVAVATPDWGALAADLALPIRITDLAGNILYTNRQFQLAVAPAAHEPDAPQLSDIIQQLETSGQPLQFDLRLNLLDRIYVYRTRHQLRRIDAENSVVVSTFTDITEQDFFQHRLQLTQSRMEDLIKLTGDWVWETDASLKLSSASARIFELTGWHVRELLGREFFGLMEFAANICDPATAQPKLLQQLTPFRELVCTMQARNGELHTLKLSGMPQFDRDDGRFLGYRGTATDITQALRAERQAALLERRLSHAIDSMSEGFALFDAQGYLVLVNPVFRQFYPNSEHLLTPGIKHMEIWQQIVRRGDVDTLGWGTTEWIAARQEHFEKARKPFEIKLADGRYLLLHDYRTEDGGTVSITADITDIKQREEELLRARQIAEGANRAKTEFFAKMSHELRTPLNAIIGFSDVMGQEKLGPLGASAYKDYAADINDSAGHLLHLINDILDVSKAEAGKLELQEQNVSIESAVQSSVRMLSDRAQAQNIVIDQSAVDKNLVLRGDGKKIRQILINLLSNAVKFTPPGGNIALRAEADGNNIIIAVRDSGIGMDPADIPKVLTAFAQVDNAMNRKYDGTGLGLPLSLALAELHGGTLQIDSALGHGTTITVRLPISRLVQR